MNEWRTKRRKKWRKIRNDIKNEWINEKWRDEEMKKNRMGWYNKGINKWRNKRTNKWKETERMK